MSKRFKARRVPRSRRWERRIRMERRLKWFYEVYAKPPMIVNRAHFPHMTDIQIREALMRREPLIIEREPMKIEVISLGLKDFPNATLTIVEDPNMPDNTIRVVDPAYFDYDPAEGNLSRFSVPDTMEIDPRSIDKQLRSNGG